MTKYNTSYIIIWVILVLLNLQTMAKLPAKPTLVNNQKSSEKIIQKLRRESELNIVLEYYNLHLNPLYSYTTSEAQIHIALNSGLLTYDPADLHPSPAIAQSWKRSPDGLNYTFTLRKDARFSNGDPITATTVFNTWVKLIEVGDQAPFSSLLDIVLNANEFRNGSLPIEKLGLKVLNPRELKITLRNPSPEILAILCHHSLSPVHPSLLEQKSWKSIAVDDISQIITSGPYQIKEMRSEGLVLSQNPYYWDADKVASKTIFIQRFQDGQEAELADAINSYQIDWVASGFSDYSKLNHSANLINISKLFSTTLLYFSDTNNKANSWSAKAVRQALVQLLPLEELRNTLGGDSYLIPQIPFYDSGKTYKSLNEEKAMDLLEEAGYPEGDGLGVLTILMPEGNSYQQIAEIIQKSWEKLKTNVRIRFLDPNEDIAVYKEQNFTIGILSWIGDYPDPTTFLNLWRSNSSLNTFNYHNEEYDAMLDKAQKIKGLKDRLAALAKAEEYILLEGSIIPLWHSPSFNLYDKRFLEGWYPNVLDLHPLHTIKRKVAISPGSI